MYLKVCVPLHEDTRPRSSAEGASLGYTRVAFSRDAQYVMAVSGLPEFSYVSLSTLSFPTYLTCVMEV